MSPHNRSDQLWSIILAGGEGKTDEFSGPTLVGPAHTEAVLHIRRHSLHVSTHAGAERAELTPPNRIVTVVAQEPPPRSAGTVRWHRGGARCFFQPANRDTAAGVFLPLAYIRARAPQATVVLYPSDHFVYPEDRFLEVGPACSPDRGVANRSGGDAGRGPRPFGARLWVDPGRTRLLAAIMDTPVRAVRSFLEKPDTAQADVALRGGALWNTLVFAANVDLLWRAKLAMPSGNDAVL